LLHGIEPVLPFDLVEATFMVEGFYLGMSTAELLAKRIQQLHKHADDIAHAAEVLKKARFKSREQFIRRFEKRLQNLEFNPGDLVLIRNVAQENTVNRFKYLPRYIGPYIVVKRTQRGNYVLQEMDGTTLQAAIAGFRVIPYLTREDPRLYELSQLHDEGDDNEEIRSAHGSDSDIEMASP
jgi:hypothetical protein